MKLYWAIGAALLVSAPIMAWPTSAPAASEPAAHQLAVDRAADRIEQMLR